MTDNRNQTSLWHLKMNQNLKISFYTNVRIALQPHSRLMKQTRIKLNIPMVGW